MVNIRLLCAAGMSTSYLVEKMRTACAKRGIEANISAHSIGDAKEKGADADIIYIGPQVAFNLKKVQALFPDKPVEVIDFQTYGLMDGEKLIAHTVEVLKL